MLVHYGGRPHHACQAFEKTRVMLELILQPHNEQLESTALDIGIIKNSSFLLPISTSGQRILIKGRILGGGFFTGRQCNVTPTSLEHCTRLPQSRVSVITGPSTHSVGGQTSNGRWCLSSSFVDCNAAGGWAGRPPGGRHCTAGQYGYVPLRRHLVYFLLREVP